MAIPEFAATDHYEFKKWASALRDRLKDTYQTLFDVLDDEKAKKSAIEKALVAADRERGTLAEALPKLPPNLAGMLREYTDRYSEKLDKVVPRAKERLKA